MSTMSVMAPSGHVTITWDPKDETSVKEAERVFDDLKKKGYHFWVLKGMAGKKVGKKIDSFRAKDGRLAASPEEEVVAAPAMTGG